MEVTKARKYNSYNWSDKDFKGTVVNRAWRVTWNQTCTPFYTELRWILSSFWTDLIWFRFHASTTITDRLAVTTISRKFSFFKLLLGGGPGEFLKKVESSTRNSFFFSHVTDTVLWALRMNLINRKSSLTLYIQYTLYRVSQKTWSIKTT